MRRFWGLIVGMITLVAWAAMPALAGSFSDVPIDHPAYAAACRLADRGLVSDRPELESSNALPLTRYEFALVLDEALTAISKRSLSTMTRSEVTTIAADLSELAKEFADVIPVVQLSPEAVERTIASMRRYASPRLADLGGVSGASGGRAFYVAPGRISEVWVTRGSAQLGVGYGLLDSAYSNSPSSQPVEGLATPSRLALSTPIRAAWQMGSTESQLQALRGRFEYGVSSSLSLGVGYQTLRQERLSPGDADVARLRTLAMGYRMSPRMTFSLRYHLIDYADKSSATTRSEERLTEAEIAIRF